jgi:hypothetical protein
MRVDHDKALAGIETGTEIKSRNTASKNPTCR